MLNKSIILTLLCLFGIISPPTLSQGPSIPDSLYNKVVSLKKQLPSDKRNKQILTLFFELIIHYHPTMKGHWRDSLYIYSKSFKSEYGKNLSGLAKAERLYQEGNIKEGSEIFLESISNLEKTNNYAQASFGLLRLGSAKESMVQNSHDKTYPIYYSKALTLATKSEQAAYLVLAWGYIADWHLEKQQFNEVVKTSFKMLDIIAEDKTYSATQYLGAAYKYLGFGYLGLKNISKAEKYLNLARIWTRSPGRSLYLDYSIRKSLAEYYYKYKHHRKALAQIDSAIVTLSNWKANTKLVDADKYLSNVYELKYKCLKDLGQTDSALIYLEKLNTQTNLNIKNELDKSYQEFHEKYSLKEKEVKIIELNNKSLKQENHIRNLLIFFLSSVLLLSIILAIVLHRSLKLRQKNIEFSLELAQTQNQMIKKEIQTQETERQRLAKDLHDDLGGTLSVIKGKIANEKVSQEAINLVEQAIEDLRYISRNLSPPELENDGLIISIKNTIDRVQNVSNIKFAFITFGEKQKLNQDIKLNIYRIITELINNILKHSKAQNAIIQLIYYQESLQILVEDDGIGIKSDKNNWGIGLKNINSRVEFLGAKLDIDSGAKGTTVIIELPLKVKNNEAQTANSR
ncbi:two-component sensor histidine kinase [Emticicia aquatilis]|uniref:histidine kinase n=1 Tax=Emticicia aquatilis TaxID=1537369 RepID=A0A916YUL4_9BACT|nr:sensor histidine kinase [Emticicia aquatilis]GGD61691.1 two-component sensor histidine kinase [Emticicia aquatilis]